MPKTWNSILEYGTFREGGKFWNIYSRIRCLKHGMFHFFLKIIHFQNLFYCQNYRVSSSKSDFKLKIEILHLV